VSTSKGVDPERLKQLIAQAADIASVVPEPMQDAAFNRALDQLMAGADERSGSRGSAQGQEAPREKKKTRIATENDERGAIKILKEIDRSSYPEVFAVSRVAERALLVLKLADEDFGVQWLTASEIAEILSERFRLPATRQGVGQALSALPRLLNDRKIKGPRGGQVTEFRIMEPGLKHLKRLPDEQPASATASTARSTQRRTRKAGAAKKPSAASGTKKRKSEGRNGEKSAGRRREGPKAAVTTLIAEGFFNKPQTMAATQEHLRHKKGLTFKVSDLSPTFVRLLREGLLDRDRNEAGQYEYKRP
jgi:hypothetical protein